MSKTWKDAGSSYERDRYKRIDRNEHKRDKHRINAFRCNDLQEIMRADDYEEPEDIIPSVGRCEDCELDACNLSAEEHKGWKDKE